MVSFVEMQSRPVTISTSLRYSILVVVKHRPFAMYLIPQHDHLVYNFTKHYSLVSLYHSRTEETLGSVADDTIYAHNFTMDEHM